MSKIDSNYLSRLRQSLDVQRIKTEQSSQHNSLNMKDLEKRDNAVETKYRVNGEYYYNIKLQYSDFEMLKNIYQKVATNFFILNNSVKDIIYKWPEKKKSIELIIKEEREKLYANGDNSYANKLHSFITDGETVNKSFQEDLSFREFNLPREYGHPDDIERDPIFSTPRFSPSKKLKP